MGVGIGLGCAMNAYTKRTGRDATHAIGDVDAILARIAEYVDAGVSKFILRPLDGDDDAILAQTRLLIEQVLPRAEARRPKRPNIIMNDR
jgi:alkanesulfonate monooxygenase SsuD/methylene tetrahydromethanopterin reductase-like flavin-dependent oxidoreductase (luciferase family)